MLLSPPLDLKVTDPNLRHSSSAEEAAMMARSWEHKKHKGLILVLLSIGGAAAAAAAAAHHSIAEFSHQSTKWKRFHKCAKRIVHICMGSGFAVATAVPHLHPDRSAPHVCNHTCSGLTAIQI